MLQSRAERIFDLLLLRFSNTVRKSSALPDRRLAVQLSGLNIYPFIAR
jgi:hypothetical protein